MGCGGVGSGVYVEYRWGDCDFDGVGITGGSPDGVEGCSGEGLVSGDTDTGGDPVVPLSSGTLPPPGGTEPPQVCSDELLSITLQARNDELTTTGFAAASPSFAVALLRSSAAE